MSSQIEASDISEIVLSWAGLGWAGAVAAASTTAAATTTRSATGTRTTTTAGEWSGYSPNEGPLASTYTLGPKSLSDERPKDTDIP